MHQQRGKRDGSVLWYLWSNLAANRNLCSCCVGKGEFCKELCLWKICPWFQKGSAKRVMKICLLVSSSELLEVEHLLILLILGGLLSAAGHSEHAALKTQPSKVQHDTHLRHVLTPAKEKELMPFVPIHKESSSHQ